MIHDDQPFLIQPGDTDPLGMRPRLDRLWGSLQSRTQNHNPLCIGVFGEYGIGKSSALLYLKKCIEENRASCILLHPWRYDLNNGIRRHILADVILSSGSLTTKTGSKEIGQKLLQSINVDVNLGIVAVGVSGEKLAASTPNGIDISSLNYFKDQFGEYLRELSCDNPIYILVDDLDRCPPQTAAETLTCLLNYCFLERVTIIIGCDKAVLERNLAIAWSDYGAEYPKHFLDKFFQAEIFLSSSKDNSFAFLDSLITASHSSQNVASSAILHRHTEQILEVTENNPRKIKRFLNNVLLALAERELDSSPQPEPHADIVSKHLLRVQNEGDFTAILNSPLFPLYLSKTKQILEATLSIAEREPVEAILAFMKSGSSEVSGSNVASEHAGLLDLVRQTRSSYPQLQALFRCIDDPKVQAAISCGEFTGMAMALHQQLDPQIKRGLKAAFAEGSKKLTPYIFSVPEEKQPTALRFVGTLVAEASTLNEVKEAIGSKIFLRDEFLIGFLDTVSVTKWQAIVQQLDEHELSRILSILPESQKPCLALQMEPPPPREWNESNYLKALLACRDSMSLQKAIAFFKQSDLQTETKLVSICLFCARQSPHDDEFLKFLLDHFRESHLRLRILDFFSRSIGQAGNWKMLGLRILQALSELAGDEEEGQRIRILDEFAYALSQRKADGADWLHNSNMINLFDSPTNAASLALVLHHLGKGGAEIIVDKCGKEVLDAVVNRAQSYPHFYEPAFLDGLRSQGLLTDR